MLAEQLAPLAPVEVAQVPFLVQQHWFTVHPEQVLQPPFLQVPLQQAFPPQSVLEQQGDWLLLFVLQTCVPALQLLVQQSLFCVHAPPADTQAPQAARTTRGIKTPAMIPPITLKVFRRDIGVASTRATSSKTRSICALPLFYEDTFEITEFSEPLDANRPVRAARRLPSSPSTLGERRGLA